MLNPATEPQLRPPALIPSLLRGFNAVAGNVYIILIPVALDVFLWFVPMLRVRNLLLPGMLRALEFSSAAYGDESGILVESTAQSWTVLLEGFNLLFGLRTYPIGVPSLMVNQGAVSNPLGRLRIFEMLSMDTSVLVILLVSLAGILLGSLYFSLIAAAAADTQQKPALPAILRRGLQSILLSIILLVTILAIGLPMIFLLSGIVLFLPALGALPFTLFGILFVWALLPLAFSPHGIFTDQLRAHRSIMMSVTLVRSLMAASGLFLMIAILLSYGMDILWSTPAPDSWMMLVGIVGHAFISSGLLAASFVFYRDGTRWLSARMQSQAVSVKQADG